VKKREIAGLGIDLEGRVTRWFLQVI